MLEVVIFVIVFVVGHLVMRNVVVAIFVARFLVMSIGLDIRLLANLRLLQVDVVKLEFPLFLLTAESFSQLEIANQGFGFRLDLDSNSADDAISAVVDAAVEEDLIQICEKL